MDTKNRTETNNQAKMQNTKAENQNPRNKAIAPWLQEGRGHPIGVLVWSAVHHQG